jgi:uncharacterized protein (DUF488 family)
MLGVLGVLGRVWWEVETEKVRKAGCCCGGYQKLLECLETILRQQIGRMMRSFSPSDRPHCSHPVVVSCFKAAHISGESACVYKRRTFRP